MLTRISWDYHKVEIKCTISVMSLNHPVTIPSALVCGKLSSMKLVLGAKTVGNCCLRVDSTIQLVDSQENVAGTGSFCWVFIKQLFERSHRRIRHIGLLPFWPKLGPWNSHVPRFKQLQTRQGREVSRLLSCDNSRAHSHPVTDGCTADKCVLIPHPPPKLTEPSAERPDPTSPPPKPGDSQLWAQPEAQRWWEVWAA